jgi:hypothetical protein
MKRRDFIHALGAMAIVPFLSRLPVAECPDIALPATDTDETGGITRDKALDLLCPSDTLFEDMREQLACSMAEYLHRQIVGAE